MLSGASALLPNQVYVLSGMTGVGKTRCYIIREGSEGRGRGFRVRVRA